ncbi:uncharacterized protein [Alexandromys fortis]|uniref:uncharacterized protein isoform X2 n=1 Tax=Alexandromys fortis TaxID=100897 RepID=UPI0021525FA8|nr:uncharacterized protein LOC126499328 isoform X2 [Microtus fortis]
MLEWFQEQQKTVRCYNAKDKKGTTACRPDFPSVSPDISGATSLAQMSSSLEKRARSQGLLRPATPPVLLEALCCSCGLCTREALERDNRMCPSVHSRSTISLSLTGTFEDLWHGFHCVFHPPFLAARSSNEHQLRPNAAKYEQAHPAQPPMLKYYPEFIVSHPKACFHWQPLPITAYQLGQKEDWWKQRNSSAGKTDVWQPCLADVSL